MSTQHVERESGAPDLDWAAAVPRRTKEPPHPLQRRALSLEDALVLQRSAGNRATAAFLGGPACGPPMVQRDGPDPPTGAARFSPAPAPGVNPPSPPVPGSPEEARVDALRIGGAYGATLADIEAGFDVVNREWGGRSTWDGMKPEEKTDWVNKAAQRFAQLPTAKSYDKPECIAAQDEGFRTGFAAAYDLGKATTFMVKLGTDAAVMLIIAVAATGFFSRFLSRLLPRVVLGGAEGETMTLYRYCKAAGDVEPGGWWTTRQAASRAEAARLTGVPENECLYEQSVPVNAAPSKYEPYFKSGTPRSVGDALVEEFRNNVMVPQSVMRVRSIGN